MLSNRPVGYPFSLMVSQALSTTTLHTSFQFLLLLFFPISGLSSQTEMLATYILLQTATLESLCSPQIHP